MKVSEMNKEEKNGMWKGDNVGYAAVHDWVKNRKPKPKVCKTCQKHKPLALHNKDKKYSRKLDKWEWLCFSCHHKKDEGYTKTYTKSIIKKCGNCSKEFFITPININHVKYCSRKCYLNKNQKRINRVHRKWYQKNIIHMRTWWKNYYREKRRLIQNET